MQERIHEFALRRPSPYPHSSPLPFSFSSPPLSYLHLPIPLEAKPLKVAKDLGSAVSSLPGSGEEPRPKTNLVHCQKATGGNHLVYFEVLVLQQNDQNLALANMAKNANDDTMTRHQLRGCSGTPHRTCVLSWSRRRKSSVKSRDKAPAGGLDCGQSPQKLKRSY